MPPSLYSDIKNLLNILYLNSISGEKARKGDEKDKPHKLTILEITDQILRVGVVGETCEIILCFTGEETEAAY